MSLGPLSLLSLSLLLKRCITLFLRCQDLNFHLISSSSLHANTPISIRFCSGQPGSHDISRALSRSCSYWLMMLFSSSREPPGQEPFRLQWSWRRTWMWNLKLKKSAVQTQQHTLSENVSVDPRWDWIGFYFEHVNEANGQLKLH